MHRSNKFVRNNLSSCNPEILTLFLEIHLGFSWTVNLARSATMVVCFLSSWLNLVQIYRIIAENDWHLDVRLMTSCELTSGSISGHVDISTWSFCIFVPNIFIQYGYISIWRHSTRQPSAMFVGGSRATIHESHHEWASWATKAHSWWLSV